MKGDRVLKNSYKNKSTALSLNVRMVKNKMSK